MSLSGPKYHSEELGPIWSENVVHKVENSHAIFICAPTLFALIARISKCDFWNLWKISDRHDIFPKKQYLFFEMKIFLEKIEKTCFLEIFSFFQ